MNNAATATNTHNVTLIDDIDPIENHEVVDGAEFYYNNIIWTTMRDSGAWWLVDAYTGNRIELGPDQRLAARHLTELGAE